MFLRHNKGGGGFVNHKTIKTNENIDLSNYWPCNLQRGEKITFDKYGMIH